MAQTADKTELKRNSQPDESDLFDRTPKKGAQNVQIVCDLYDMAVTMKSLELRRKNPEAPEQWILSEALNLIERGCR